MLKETLQKTSERSSRRQESGGEIKRKPVGRFRIYT
jgi:hypothetical protein